MIHQMAYHSRCHTIAILDYISLCIQDLATFSCYGLFVYVRVVRRELGVKSHGAHWAQATPRHTGLFGNQRSKHVSGKLHKITARQMKGQQAVAHSDPIYSCLHTNTVHAPTTLLHPNKGCVKGSRSLSGNTSTTLGSTIIGVSSPLLSYLPPRLVKTPLSSLCAILPPQVECDVATS